MKVTPATAWAAPILAALLAGFCALTPAPASAQAPLPGRGDIFTVAAVPVDVTANNAAAAQTQGFAAAAQIGFQRLAQRLTLPADRQRTALPQPDPTLLQNLAVSTDVVAERRSATHYVAQLTVHFNPDLVRTVLHQAGFANLIEQRQAPVLVSPQSDAGTAPDTLAAWRAAWSDGGFANEITPLAIAPENASGGDWSTLYPYAQAQAASTAIVAVLRVQGTTVTASVREVNAAAARERGVATVQLSGTDPASLRAALGALAQQVNAALQDGWKARIAATPTQAVTSARISASVLYSNQAQWEAIKNALQGAASTLISQIRIEAVARDGALVSFTYIGDRTQVAAELARRGVTLSDSPNGPVLRVAAQR